MRVNSGRGGLAERETKLKRKRKQGRNRDGDTELPDVANTNLVCPVRFKLQIKKKP